MDTRTIAEIDDITRDFMGQLLLATEREWQREKPDHYRAVVAAIETVLGERRAMAERQVGDATCREQGVPSMRRIAGLLPLTVQWAKRPRLSLLTASRHRLFRSVETM